ncbi:MAG: hypothetical protein NDI61_04520 [Bdellovibrionaceae bacterium]|nr:hypothetical protein [Pseudobdellovibrionaceae bacterium]
MKLKSIAAVAAILACHTVSAAKIDCSEVYKASATCERVACDEKYQSFIGTWSGPFQAYSQELSTQKKSVYRGFQNTITYSEADCLKNVDNGDVFIVGRRTDAYAPIENLPAKTETGLLITGKKKDGSPFLRTVDSNVLFFENGTKVAE